MSLERIARLYSRLLAKYEHAGLTLARERKRLTSQRRGLRRALTAQTITQNVAQQVQQQAHAQIAQVVTRCLQACFDQPLRFRVDFHKKRGKTEAELVFLEKVKGKWIKRKPTDESGIGQVDVAAFALRLACLMLQKPAKRRVLIVDEPFKNVNGERNRERVAELLESLAEEFGVQIILTTGYDWLKVGKVVEL
jgi:uncharacterized protein YydD (DUF2326 family)